MAASCWDDMGDWHGVADTSVPAPARCATAVQVNSVGPGVTRTSMLATLEQLRDWVEGLAERVDAWSTR